MERGVLQEGLESDLVVLAGGGVPAALMGALVDTRFAETDGRALVKVGYFHAQKRPLFGTLDTYLGEYLVDESPHARGTTYPLVVAPAAGERVVVHCHSDFATVPQMTHFDGFALLRRVEPTARQDSASGSVQRPCL